jgi:hypothetical protein
MRALDQRDAEKIDELFPERVKTIAPGRLWTWDEAKKELKQHTVWTGVTDGQFTEIVRGDPTIQVGTVVVSSIILPQPQVAPGGQQNNLFGQPNMRGGGGPGGGGGGNSRGGGGGGGGRGGR